MKRKNKRKMKKRDSDERQRKRKLLKKLPLLPLRLPKNSLRLKEVKSQTLLR